MPLPRALADRKFMSVSEAAKELAVSVATARRWCDEGRLKVKVHPLNHYRFVEPKSVKDLKARLADFS